MKFRVPRVRVKLFSLLLSLLLFLSACAARTVFIPSDREIIRLPDGRLSISEGYFLEIVEELNRCGER